MARPDAYEKLQNILKAVRQRAGLTQAELAVRLRSRAQSYVSKMENGDRTVDVVEFLEWLQECKADEENEIADFIEVIYGALRENSRVIKTPRRAPR